MENDLSLEDTVVTIWIWVNTLFVFWMQIGFALLEVAQVRARHIESILMKNVLDWAVSITAWWAFGFALASDSDSQFSGNRHWFLWDVHAPLGYLLFLLKLGFAATSTTVVSGAVAERCKLQAYIVFCAIYTAFTYSISSHWVWSATGWLGAYRGARDPSEELFSGCLGYMDYAGGSVVHAQGGVAALVAVYMLGPRVGRFTAAGAAVGLHQLEGPASVHKVVGTFILFLCFISFNAGSSLKLSSIYIGAKIATNTCLSSAAGCFTAMAVQCIFWRFRLDLNSVLDGLLAGAVAITGPCALIEPWAAIVVGVGAGLLYSLTSWAMLRARLDDVVSAVPVHFLPGAWGVVAIGLFATRGNIANVYDVSLASDFDVGVAYGGNGTLLGVQCLGVLIITAWAGVWSVLIFYTLHVVGWLRTPDDEQTSALLRSNSMDFIASRRGGPCNDGAVVAVAAADDGAPVKASGGGNDFRASLPAALTASLPRVLSSRRDGARAADAV